MSLPGGQPILVAVAWPYASGPRHLGHVAGFGVPSDIFSRYQRLRGNRVLMISGTDEHGTPIMVAADAQGVSPGQLADRYNLQIVEDLRDLGLSYDLFTRTTTTNHYRVVQDVFSTLHAKGYLIERKALGAFSASTGRTLPDRYVEGTCPVCANPAARGDQCDACGNQLDPIQLIDPRSTIDGVAPVFRETEHFFLDLPALAEQLADWIDKSVHWRSNVRTFAANLVADLRPRPVTRDLDWGVPIPLPGYEGRDDKRIYVWFDAVVGYLSASVEWAEMQGTPDAWRDWWQNEESRHYYFMGKDNIVFHTIIWPSMLLGIGNGGQTVGGRGHRLQLPYDIVSSEFLTMEGMRFSASRGVGIYVRDFLDRYEPDSLRYYLTAAGPETADSDFTWSEFVRRTNDELIANWGNLAHRTLTTAHRHFGAVPTPSEFRATDRRMLETVQAGFNGVGSQLDRAQFRGALRDAMRISAEVNRYLADEEPWKVVHGDRERAATVLWVALQCVHDISTLLAPFLPFSSQRLHEQLGGEGTVSPMPVQIDADGDPHRVLTGDYAPQRPWGHTPLPSGRRLDTPTPLFRKLDPDLIEAELELMRQRAEGVAEPASR